MGKRLLTFLLTLMALAATAMAADKRFTLVIDAGHGGHDHGAVGKISKEKNINLNVALAFGRYVESNMPDVKVVYTRKSDVFIPLHRRADIANKSKADLFISIHTNALPKRRIARGVETYTLGMHRAADNLDVAKRENSVIQYEKDYKQRYEGFDPNSAESYIIFEFLQDKYMAQSVELARFVQKRVCATAKRPDKGVKQAGFLVLRETSMPSCLIELGFISTPDEERFLNTKRGIDRLGRGIFLAFVDYKNKYDKNITAPYRPSAALQAPEADAPESAETPNTAPPRAEKPQNVETQHLASPREETASPREKTASPRTEPAASAAEAQPIFKVQILTSSRKLAQNARQFKGHKGVERYAEGGTYKYTLGSSADYNAINRLRRRVAKDFPGAFIIAFRNGQRMDVNEAIREFKRNRNKTK